MRDPAVPRTRHGIETRISRNGRPAARITRLGGPGDDAAECEKILAGYADDPGPASSRGLP